MSSIEVGSADLPLVRHGWQPIETAPKDGTTFLALNDDGELWPATFITEGRPKPQLAYRTNRLDKSSRHRVHIINDKRLLEELESSEQWSSHWTFWSRGYKFTPTHWLPLPEPPTSKHNLQAD